MLLAEDVFTVPEAAIYLRCSVATVQRALHRGQIPGVKVGRQWRLLRQNVDAYLQGAWSGQSRVFYKEPSQ